jgi:O-antigen ligase
MTTTAASRRPLANVFDLLHEFLRSRAAEEEQPVSGPIRGVGLTLVMLPLWWVMGLEQFIWPVVLGCIATTVVLTRREWVWVGAARWLALFVVIHVISGLFIVESFRLITFSRNLGAYVAGLCLLIIVPSCARSWQDIRFLLLSLLWLLLGSLIVGALGVFDVWRPTFTSAVGSVAPGNLAGSSYGSRIATRSAGDVGWFFGFTYFRVTSMFMYATIYGTTLAVLTPIVLFIVTRIRSRMVLLLAAGLLPVLALNLVFTTARVAFLALVLSGMVFALFYSKRSRMTWLVLSFGLLALLPLAVGGGALPAVGDTVSSVVLARGEGSYVSRMAVYQATLSGVTERPIFGWGTERDVPGLRFPAGSHSHYLGILYKQGVVGLLVFLALLASVWRDTRPVPLSSIKGQDGGHASLLRFGRWAFILIVINGATDVLDLDATTMVVIWTVIATLIATRRQLLFPPESTVPQPTQAMPPTSQEAVRIL